MTIKRGRLAHKRCANISDAPRHRCLYLTIRALAFRCFRFRILPLIALPALLHVGIWLSRAAEHLTAFVACGVIARNRRAAAAVRAAASFCSAFCAYGATRALSSPFCALSARAVRIWGSFFGIAAAYALRRGYSFALTGTTAPCRAATACWRRRIPRRARAQHRRPRWVARLPRYMPRAT